MPTAQDDLEKILVGIASSSKSKPKKSDFESPDKPRKDASKLDEQKSTHRSVLLYLVVGLSIASFLLLAYVVIDQMNYRKGNYSYTGVSDSVMKILAVSVFGQVIAVVATIVRHVWKDPQ